jgi:prephenate dehydrogenase
MKRLAVIGPGLLGGSIALAAARLPDWSVAPWARRPEAVAELRERHRFEHASHDLRAVAREADLVILCVPIGAMPALAAELAPVIPPHAIVTDVGSVKGPVAAALTPLFSQRGHFIGSHPMAGSEQTGMKAARADLFRGSVCILTPEEASRPEAVQALRAFWEALGCRVRELSPAQHDETVGLISHLPHLVAAALVRTVQMATPGAIEFAGPGFRDTTRVAAGPPEMWAEILTSNRAAVQKWTEAMIEKLHEILTLLDHATPGGQTMLNEYLAQAKADRDRLPPLQRP